MATTIFGRHKGNDATKESSKQMGKTTKGKDKKMQPIG